MRFKWSWPRTISVALCAISFAFLTSCAEVKIHDGEWCGDIGASGASCFHTISTSARDLTKEQWDLERFGWLCTSPQSFAEWKTALLKLCDYSDICTYEEIKVLEALEVKLQRVKTNASTQP